MKNCGRQVRQIGKPGNKMKLNNAYYGKTVLITGNTGFKGSWLAQWLHLMGANVIGYSLRPTKNPSHFGLLKLDYKTYFNDINDLDKLTKVLNETNPEIIFHLAAQSLVRYAYQNPLETYQTNVMGTMNILESAKNNGKIKAIVVVTTDKCYENIEQNIGFKETDKMGGHDPYSSSKACVEILTSSYRNSFFNLAKYNITHSTLVATARAGNVIGGGDWSSDRLIPDIIRGAIKNKTTLIRNPMATRPWQHVLEPLSGYLELGMRLLHGELEFAEGWNFGPEESDCLSVIKVLDKASKHWGNINHKVHEDSLNPHEAGLLSLNIEKAKNKLNWHPKWNSDFAIERTILWYKDYYNNNKINTLNDLQQFNKS